MTGYVRLWMKGHLSLVQSFVFVARRNMSYYAVARGRNAGVYRSWDECKAQVDKYGGAAYKKFSSLAEANNFISERGGPSVSCRQSSRNNAKPYPGGQSKPREYFSTKARSFYKSYTKPETIRDSSGSENSSRSTMNYPTTVSKKGFTVDRDGRVEIYTDGACSSNGNKNAKAGLGVYFGDNHPENVSKAVRGRPTNNNAEIQAVTEAARVAQRNGFSKIRIKTDSAFLINCKTKWMPGWKARDWKTSCNKPVINREELEEMERALAPLDVEFEHVRGHAGIHGNEKADELAKAGADLYKK